MIRTVPETGSTNADLLAEAEAGAPEGLWLRAERQSSGRGRLARAWRSPAGNLYASSIVRLQVTDPQPASLALVAGVALHEVAAAWAPDASLRLKWPNDLLAGRAKVAGILLERSGDAVIAGFGVNLANAPDLPDRAAASLARPGTAAPDPALFLEDLAGALVRWLRIWRGQGLKPVRDAWQAAAHPLGSALTASVGDDRLDGLFAGLDDDGNLLLTLVNGRVETIAAGDVFLL